MNFAVFLLGFLLLYSNILTSPSCATPQVDPLLKLESQKRLEVMIAASERHEPPLNLQHHDFTKDRFSHPCRDLKDLDLRGAHLEGANFQGMRLRNVNLSHAHLQKANFEDCVLEEVKMEGADLSLANFKNAKVSKTSFSQAQMLGTNFENAELTATNFEDSVLRCANMSYANLTRANLAESDLWCARFDNTKTLDTHFGHTRRSCPEDPARICREYLENKLDLNNR